MRLIESVRDFDWTNSDNRADFQRMSNNLCPPITAENAREMSALGWAKRKTRQAELENAERELKELKQALKDGAGDDSRAIRMSKQMDAIERVMKKTEDSKELANLSAAHARLFSAWCVLTGTKSPGTMGKSRRSERPAPIQPIPAPIESSPPTPGQPRSEDCTG